MAQPKKTGSTPTKRNWMKILLIVAAGIIVFILAVTAFTNTATKDAAKVSDAFIADLQSKNSSAGYDLFSKEAKQAVSPDDFKNVVDQTSSVLQGAPKKTGKEISGETGTSAKATIEYEIKGTDGKTYNITINLTKEDGIWKVLDFNSEAE